ncbi:MAG: imidazoleglycerol-phosphate dehydratase HisB [Thermodesulfobacteriota bacterium]
MAAERKASVERKTNEVKVSVDLNVDGSGVFDIQTGIPFFDHMLCQFARHGCFDIKIKAIGDTEVDFHHTVEDVGIVLGNAFKDALGEKEQIVRFAHSYVPFEDTLVFSAVDISGRPCLVFDAELPKSKVGDFDSELAREFFKSFSNNLGCNLHIRLEAGENLHHNIEAMFKSCGRTFDIATSTDGRYAGVPSTKGAL